MTLYNYQEDLKQYEEIKIKLKQDLEKFIQDREFSLDERWKRFCKYPIELKNNKPWLEHFDCESEAPRGEIIWYDDFYKERYTTINTIQVVELMKEKKWSKDFIDKFKEEVLQKNLGSFIYDW